MRVLTVNPGSSSVKLAIVADGVELSSVGVDTATAEQTRGPLTELAMRWQPVDAVGVRFVHGGDRSSATLLDTEETARLAGLVDLAPLHQPLSLELAALATATVAAPVVACFDTAFHAHMPEPATRYALPKAWAAKYGLRRYGFHGLSCAHALRRSSELLHREADAMCLVCCHIGSGVSVTAIRDGHSVDTSMGFTPLEGAAMSTRSGSVDPGLLIYLLRTEATDVKGLEQALEHGSGLAGLTGTNGDMRDVLAARTAGDSDAELAVQVYLHRLRREIGAVAISLDRVDALVLTGGVAEHQPDLIAELVEGLELLGVTVDPDRVRGTGDRLVSPVAAPVDVLVVTAQEGLEIARQTTNYLAMNGAT
ncbi:MAG TPA: acetate/propionate family kinase [Pseudonocardiaceae bacterium]|nr:acetate/propionate family kinase [Pseudonocardiaceae bacterium]